VKKKTFMDKVFKRIRGTPINENQGKKAIQKIG
jgi:hypothetical protein